MFTNGYRVRRHNESAVTGRARATGLLLALLCLTAYTMLAGCGPGKKEEKDTYKPPTDTRGLPQTSAYR